MGFYFNYLFSSSTDPFWSSLQEISFGTLQLIIFYLNYSWICPRTIPQKKWVWFIIGQFFLLLLFPTLRNLFEEVIIYEITGIHNYQENYRLNFYYLYDNSYYAARIILFSLIFYFLKETWNNQKKFNVLVLKNKQAELENLKNQFSPHFLFNTLNSFYADLMEKEPETANDILSLSDMLRYVTYENKSGIAGLEEEIEFIKNYIKLFSRRFDHQLALQTNFPVEVTNEKIPALLLIHFVENALKHGTITDPDKPIKIDLSISNKTLNFKVENYYNSSEHYDAGGIGYNNVKQRLALIYEDNYTLNIQSANNYYKVELKIPLIQ